jgi:hypothetical protein
MVFYAWGKPDAVNESLNLDDQKQEWIYKRPDGKTRHLHFENDLLTAIRE